MSTLTKTPRDFLRIVFKHWRLFALAWSAAAVAVLIASQLLPLQYTGTTVFERRVDPAIEEFTKGKPESFASQKLTLQNDLMGHSALVRVINELRLVPELVPGASPDQVKSNEMARQAMEMRLANNLKIDWRISSEQVDTVSLSFTDPKPELAQKVPNLLVQIYNDSTAQQVKNRLTESVNFLAQRVEDAKKGLQDARQRRLEFEAENAQKYPQPGALQQRVGQLTTEINTLRPQLELAKQKEEQLKVAMSSSTTQSSSRPSQQIWGPNPDRIKLQEELKKAQEELRIAIYDMNQTDKHPRVIGLKKKIADLEAQIAAMPERINTQDIFDVAGQTSLQLQLAAAAARAEVEMYTSRLSQAQQELADLQTNVAQYSKAAQQYNDLIKVEDQRAEEYKNWNARHNELQMTLLAVMRQHFTLSQTIKAAGRQFIPSSPKLWMVMGGAVLGGFCFGGGLVFLRQMIDRTFSTQEEAQSGLALPVYGVISEIVSDQQRRARRRNKLLRTPLIGVVVLLAIGGSAMLATLRLRQLDLYNEITSHPVQTVGKVLTGQSVHAPP